VSVLPHPDSSGRPYPRYCGIPRDAASRGNGMIEITETGETMLIPITARPVPPGTEQLVAFGSHQSSIQTDVPSGENAAVS